ncbi:uncharacterized protein LOC135926842 [Gordionus sp. m RMFG-2023]|uniref:uncharacterized protein LOC135926842 n=1 Tax=Gordionus sp. m RMFG-2023 TaxID=3053472 RepID=UPI0031FDA635
MSSILELVTVNGRPLSIIEDSGFQRIINPLLSGLNLVINKENLSRTINKTAQSIRDKISREVEGKLISLKVDAVQRLDRAIKLLQPETDYDIRSESADEENMDLTLTDFYAAWLRCCIELEKNPNHFAQLLYSCLKNREERFIKNEILLAAIYLGPRYKVLLSDDDKICAKKHLVNLWRRIKSLTTPILSDDISSDEVIEQEDDLEKLIQLKERQEKILKRGPTIAEKSIGTIITGFSDYIRLDKKENILHFWESAKLEHPELYILSKILFAVPATQVSVERSFSHLKFILSPHRSRMSEQLLEDIMLIRLNKIFKIDT